MPKIAGNIVGLPSPRSDFKQTDEMKADFIKNKPIEVRKDGFYIVDKERGIETLLASPDGYIFANDAEYADTSSYATEAVLAYEDDCGRPLKGCSTYDEGDAKSVDIDLYDGQIASFGVISTSLIASVYEEWYRVGYMSALHFTTPSVIPENYTQFPDTVQFRGDSTDDGAFVPEPDTRYSMVFFFDGNLLICCVLGVSAPPVSEVIE